MAEERRATRLDPDPLHVPEPDVRPDDDPPRSGMVIVYLLQTLGLFTDVA